MKTKTKFKDAGKLSDKTLTNIQKKYKKNKCKK